MDCTSDLFLLIGAYLPPANSLPLMTITGLKIKSANIQNWSLVRGALALYVVLNVKNRRSAVKTKHFTAEESEIRTRLPTMLSFILIYKGRKFRTEQDG